MCQQQGGKEPHLMIFIDFITGQIVKVDGLCTDLAYSINKNEQIVTSCNSQLPQDDHAQYTDKVLYTDIILEISSHATVSQ